MKRYALFAFYVYYPSGGFNDFIESSDSFDYLFQKFITKKYEGGQIIDLTTFEVFEIDRE
jgi:hypothetical protein